MLAVAGLVIFVICLIPAWRTPIAHGVSRLVSDARRAIAPSFVQVITTGAKATVSLPGHPGDLAADTGKNTYWAAPAPSLDTSPVLTVTFDHPVDAAKLGFTVGGPTDRAAALSIPQSIHLVFTDGHVKDAQLEDTRDFQVIDVDAHQATGVQIQIVSLWQKQAKAFSLAEVEVWERR
jgi:hypothetical protein